MPVDLERDRDLGDEAQDLAGQVDLRDVAMPSAMCERTSCSDSACSL